MKHTDKLAVLLAVGLLAALFVPFVFAQSGEQPASSLQDDYVYLPFVVNLEAVPPQYPPINKLVFSAGYTVEAPYHDIYVMNADGTGRTKLADGGTTSYVYPVWSPDGSKIAFTAITYIGPGDVVDQVYVMNADGSGMYNLVNIAGHHFHPAWSPYGNQIVFSSDMHNPGPDTANDLYIMNADGTGSPVRLTDTPSIHEAFPDWSPDGRQIAYMAQSGPEWELVDIYAINSDGTGQTNLTQTADIDYGPSWSPNGQQIAYQRYLPVSGGLQSQIFIMNADGSNQTQRTFNSGQNFYPDWSPDGSQIVFQMYYDQYADLYVMNADGSGATNITNTGHAYASVTADWR